jgi:hypothetical protein
MPRRPLVNRSAGESVDRSQATGSSRQSFRTNSRAPHRGLCLALPEVRRPSQNPVQPHTSAFSTPHAARPTGRRVAPAVSARHAPTLRRPRKASMRRSTRGEQGCIDTGEGPWPSVITMIASRHRTAIRDGAWPVIHRSAGQNRAQRPPPEPSDGGLICHVQGAAIRQASSGGPPRLLSAEVMQDVLIGLFCITDLIRTCAIANQARQRRHRRNTDGMRRQPHRARRRRRLHDEASPERSGEASSHGSGQRPTKDARRSLGLSPALSHACHQLRRRHRTKTP